VWYYCEFAVRYLSAVSAVLPPHDNMVYCSEGLQCNTDPSQRSLLQEDESPPRPGPLICTALLSGFPNAALGMRDLSADGLLGTDTLVKASSVPSVAVLYVGHQAGCLIGVLCSVACSAVQCSAAACCAVQCGVLCSVLTANLPSMAPTDRGIGPWVA
jgi:hypothetical protein